MKQIEEVSETLLSVALRDGSVEAFNRAFRIYHRRLYYYVAIVTRNKHDAEEIVHDIFITLWLNRAKLDPAESLQSLLFSIAYHRRINYLKKILRRPQSEDYMELQNDLISHDTDMLEYKDFCTQLNNALRTLPPRLQRMIVLSRIHNVPNAVIAEKFGIAEKTVRNQLSAGLKELKKQLNIQDNIL
jgi:RNA polymerase sigma factor, sigma-70 family